MSGGSTVDTGNTGKAGDAIRLVVLVSGNGSNLQALIDAVADGRVPARIAGVVSNRAQAFGLERAKAARIPTLVLSHKGRPDRASYDRALAELVGGFEPDLVVLAGFMRVLGRPFLRRFGERIVNLHPALPGMFPGVDAIGRAWEAAKRREIDHTGVMVHRVVEEVDAGPVLGVARVDIDRGGTQAELEAAVHAAEHRLLVEVVAAECRRLAARRAEDAGLVWPVVRATGAAADFRVFSVEQHLAAHPVSGAERVFSVVRSPAWVNVVALTPDDRVVLVRQFRHGLRRVTVEIPGGLVDAGESFVEAGRRELREETGFEAARWVEMGVVEPNPAIQDNRCGLVLALDARRTAEMELDEGEHIAVETAALAEVRGMIARGEIRHALVISAFFHLVERAGGWRRPVELE